MKDKIGKIISGIILGGIAGYAALLYLRMLVWAILQGQFWF